MRESSDLAEAAKDGFYDWLLPTKPTAERNDNVPMRKTHRDEDRTGMGRLERSH
ncbi:hypothetical protein JCM19992_23280 [Thermostilla marina]